jgi:hypothetical protein
MKNYYSQFNKICLPVFLAAGATNFPAARTKSDSPGIDRSRPDQAHSRFARRVQRGGRGRFEIRSLCPGLQLCRAGRRAISNQRQQRGQRPGPRRGSFCQEHVALAQLHRREPAAAGARVCRRHCAGHHGTRKASRRPKSRSRSKPAGGNGEIYVADFDGHNAQAITHDATIVAAPAWVPGRLAIYYTSYKRGNPDIFYHNLGTGQRHVVAGYSGLNTSAAVSPDGSKVAMILSRSGSPDVWVAMPTARI